MDTPARPRLLLWLWLPVLVAGVLLTWLLAAQASQDDSGMIDPYAYPRTALAQQVWLAGLALTALATAALALLAHQLRRAWQDHEGLETSVRRLQLQLDNSQVEKAILRQALNNSEQRSRDLVALSGGFVSELDENQRVTYLSIQIADLLDRSPTDMAEQPFQDLVAPADRDRFQAALQTARRDKAISHAQLHLLAAGNDPVPVTLRMAAVIDPFSGCTGYRLTGQLR